MSEVPLYASSPFKTPSPKTSDPKGIVKAQQTCTSVAESGAQHLWETGFRTCWQWKRITQ